MICKNCGTELSDDAVFCKVCGSQIQDDNSLSGSDTSETLSHKKKNKLPIIFASIGMVAIIAFAVGIIFLRNHNSEPIIGCWTATAIVDDDGVTEIPRGMDINFSIAINDDSSCAITAGDSNYSCTWMRKDDVQSTDDIVYTVTGELWGMMSYDEAEDTLWFITIGGESAVIYQRSNKQ